MMKVMCVFDLKTSQKHLIFIYVFCPLYICLHDDDGFLETFFYLRIYSVVGDGGFSKFKNVLSGFLLTFVWTSVKLVTLLTKIGSP